MPAVKYGKNCIKILSLTIKSPQSNPKPLATAAIMPITIAIPTVSLFVKSLSNWLKPNITL